MSLCLRLAVLLVVSSVILTPEAGIAAKCANKFYLISLKDSYLKKKYKVRAFFLYPRTEVYNIPKIPKGWIYGFKDELSTRLIAAAQTDKDALDIGYFKNFITLVRAAHGECNGKNFSMVLICNKPDGTPMILVLETNDFKIRRIHKCLNMY